MRYDILTSEQVDHFLQRGFVTIEGCFTEADARDWLGDVWVRLGYDADNPSTWTEPRIHMPNVEPRRRPRFRTESLGRDL